MNTQKIMTVFVLSLSVLSLQAFTEYSEDSNRGDWNTLKQEQEQEERVERIEKEQEVYKKIEDDLRKKKEKKEWIKSKLEEGYAVHGSNSETSQSSHRDPDNNKTAEIKFEKKEQSIPWYLRSFYAIGDYPKTALVTSLAVFVVEYFKLNKDDK